MDILELTAKRRCGEICDELAKEHWYKEATKSIIEIQEEICGFNDEIKCLLNKYDKLCLRIHHRTEEQMYISGFKDGRSSL